MERVHRLLADEEYRQSIKKLEKLEQDRIFCHHGIEHLLVVARIAWIENLEEKLGLEKEEIYLAALLHDLGRVDEYERGIPHHEAGKKRAEYFLGKLEMPKTQQKEILRAIGEHRRSSRNRTSDGDRASVNRAADGDRTSVNRAADGNRTSMNRTADPGGKLAVLLAEADKSSRNCSYCQAYEACKWSEDEKNRLLRY